LVRFGHHYRWRYPPGGPERVRLSGDIWACPPAPAGVCRAPSATAGDDPARAGWPATPAGPAGHAGGKHL